MKHLKIIIEVPVDEKNFALAKQDAEEATIIGNIFQNPELIKK